MKARDDIVFLWYLLLYPKVLRLPFHSFFECTGGETQVYGLFALTSLLKINPSKNERLKNPFFLQGMRGEGMALIASKLVL